MIQPGDHAAAAPRAGVGARLRSKGILLRDEIAVGSPELARVGLIALALTLQTIVLFSPGHFRPAGTLYYSFQVAVGTLLSLALTATASLNLKTILSVRVRRLLGIAAVVSLAVLPVLGVVHGAQGLRSIAQDTPPSNDGAVMDMYAAEQVLHHHNPYVRTNIVAALARVNAPMTTTTPLMRGQFGGAREYPSAPAVEEVFWNDLQHYRPQTIPPEFESKYNYPAGSFLFILPFIGMGLHDMRFLYALFCVLIGAYLWFRLPRTMRPLAPLLVLGNVPLVVLTSGGQPDPIYAFFLMVGYAEWGSRRLSPISMGLAIATKQLAWFFVPFYLVLVARELGWREALRRAGIMTAVFGVTNLPFIVQSPSSYVSSISGPMADPMFPLGVGIVALFVSNALPMLPKVAFTIAELASWAGGVFASWRLRYLTAATGAALAGIPLFFAWRSLVNYFYLVPLIVLAVVLAEPAQRRLVRRESV